MPNARSGLWWLAVLILIVGGALAYLRLTDPTAVGADGTAYLILAVSVALAGICIISATAHWWLKR